MIAGRVSGAEVIVILSEAHFAEKDLGKRPRVR